jgi:uncharacterized protein YqeY
LGEAGSSLATITLVWSDLATPQEQTMSLKDTLMTDMKTAMKARESVRLGTIRMMLADLKNQTLAKGGEIDEAGELALLSKHAKQRREAKDAFEKGGRQDLADNEAAELIIIEGYLPAQLSPAEVEAIVAEIVTETGASSMRDMGKVMGKLMPKVKGRFPGSEVKRYVEAALK